MDIILTSYYNNMPELINFSLTHHTLSKRPERINIIPTLSENNNILIYKYTIRELTIISKHYGVKCTGNKQTIITRLYTFLHLSLDIIKVQKIFRGYLYRKYLNSRGLGLKTRNICVNSIDFLTMDSILDIPTSQFFSYTDENNFTYAFDIISFHNLLYKTEGTIKNPYTTTPISSKVFLQYRTMLRLCRIFHIDIHTQMDNVLDAKKTELRALDIFQQINILGNYADPKWFMTLTNLQLINMLKQLLDIWVYRANLTLETKQEICPPNGNPFENRGIIPSSQSPIETIRKYALDLFEKLITLGINKDSKALGACYILGSITLVNADAAEAMPWLYQSMYYI